MKIHLLYFPGCPNLDAARDGLRKALRAEGLETTVDEIDVEAPDAPEWARGWGSPTILIDGKDVAGQTRSEAPACRLYANGAPSIDAVRERIAAARTGPASRAGRLPRPGPAMSCTRGGGGSKRDLLAGRLAFLLWCLPAALVVIGVLSTEVRPWLWIPSFTLMGLGCLANARRCGRLHCHVTGPLFLLGAALTVVDALAVTRIGWRLIIAAMMLGTVLAYGLEWVRGKYVEVPPAPPAS